MSQPNIIRGNSFNQLSIFACFHDPSQAICHQGFIHAQVLVAVGGLMASLSNPTLNVVTSHRPH